MRQPQILSQEAQLDPPRETDSAHSDVPVEVSTERVQCSTSAQELSRWQIRKAGQDSTCFVYVRSAFDPGYK